MKFADLCKKLEELKNLGNVRTEIIGKSVLGRHIYAFHVGGRGPQTIIIGAIHAREWITTLLLVEMVKETSLNPPNKCGIYFLPICNPDGVEIALDGGQPLWKSNARGVDLNVNFDADWGGGAQNVNVAGSANYIGPYPESEPETRALVSFTRRIRPKMTLAYHSKGEVIYYGFAPRGATPNARRLARDTRLAAKLGEITGYTPTRTADSAGGYTDWVSWHLKIPAFTIEVGNDALPHPITPDRLDAIWAQNRGVFDFNFLPCHNK
jgi:g-D-glutamyl-meso-diaminopimelate peptidase